MNERFGDLRSILQRAPGVHTWASALEPLRALWHTSPDRFAREIVPYVQGHVAGWPGGLRFLPASWAVPGPHLESEGMVLFDRFDSEDPPEVSLAHHIPRIAPLCDTPAPQVPSVEVLLEQASRLHLHTLTLRRATLRDGMLAELLAGHHPMCVGLEMLALEHMELERPLREGGGEAASLLRLRGLSLRGSIVGASGLSALQSKGLLDALEQLDLSGCRVSLAMLQAFSSAPCMTTTLRRLALSSNPFGDQGFLWIAERLGAAPIESLELLDLDLTFDGVRTLNRADAFLSLRALELGVRYWTAPTLITLMASPGLPQHAIRRVGFRELTLADITRQDLLDFCAYLGLRGVSRQDKPGLIATIREALRGARV